MQNNNNSGQTLLRKLFIIGFAVDCNKFPSQTSKLLHEKQNEQFLARMFLGRGNFIKINQFLLNHQNKSARFPDHFYLCLPCIEEYWQYRHHINIFYKYLHLHLSINV